MFLLNIFRGNNKVSEIVSWSGSSQWVGRLRRCFDFENEEFVECLGDREVKDADWPFVIAAQLSYHSFISAHGSLIHDWLRLSITIAIASCSETFFKIELLNALVNWKHRKERTMIELRNSLLGVINHVLREVISSEFLIDLGLKLDHFSDYNCSLLRTHLLNLFTFDLILGHICDLQHHARILQIWTYGVHFSHDLIDSSARQKLFLHQVKNSQRYSK